EEYQVPVTIVRYAGCYGPRQATSWWGGPQGVFIDLALQRQPLPVHGDGMQTRSFTFVADAIAATSLLLDSSASDGDIFNIGSSEEVTIRRLAEMIWQLIRPEEPPLLEFIPYKSFTG